MAVPEISVVLPVYNVAPYIGQCLESILSQSFENFELLCVDDCGNDGSMAIAQEFADRDKRITILRHDENRGVSAARNTGMNRARGKFIAFIDSDDWVLQDFLQSLHASIVESGVESVWANHFIYSDDDRTLRECCQPYGGVIPLTGELIKESPHWVWNKLFDLAAIKRRGLQFRHAFGEDLEFHYKFHSLSHSVYFLNKSKYIYRTRSDSCMGRVTGGDYR